jgi:hypothetical protein
MSGKKNNADDSKREGDERKHSEKCKRGWGHEIEVKQFDRNGSFRV